MLNGIDPILIFEFSKNLSTVFGVSSVPIVSSILDAVPLPAIPIYLSENITGIYIDSEDKSIDIETSTDTNAKGSDPDVNQRGINSIVTINMVANKDSLGVTLMAALCDLIFSKVTSKEYSITYLHGSITVFRGLLHTFSVSQNRDNTLLLIKMEIARSNSKITQLAPNIPELDPTEATVPLAEAGATA